MAPNGFPTAARMCARAAAKRALVLVALVASAASDDCLVTPDGAQNGQCEAAVGQLDILGYEGACEDTSSNPQAISAEDLQAVAAVETADALRVCGVLFPTSSAASTRTAFAIASYLPNLTAVAGSVTVVGNANVGVFELPALGAVGGSFAFSGNLDAEQLSLPTLQALNTSLVISSNAALKAVAADSVTGVSGHVVVRGNDNLTDVGLAAAKQFGDGSGWNAYVDNGVKYSVFVRSNAMLADLCSVDPTSIGSGVFVCDNNNGGEVQIREQLAHIPVVTTLCNTPTLPSDATCPCAQANSDPKQCKGGGPGKPPINLRDLGTGSYFTIALFTFITACFFYQRRRQQMRAQRFYEANGMGYGETTPLFVAQPVAHHQSADDEVVPPPYVAAQDGSSAAAGASSDGGDISKPPASMSHAPPAYQ